MKITVSSYSFSQLINKGLHTQFSVIGLAKELGFEGIEFTDLTPPEGITEKEYATLLKEEAERVGIEIVSYTIGANLLSDDIDSEIKRLKEKVDVAETLGTTLLRHDAYFGFPKSAPQGKSEEELFEYYLEKTADGFKKVTEYAKTKGIRTCTENHGVICQPPLRVESIINKVNDENFGWLVDMGNFLCAECDPLESVKVAAKYAFHVHAKDFILEEGKKGIGAVKGVRLGKGVVPVEKCLKVVKEAGYDSFVCVEYEGSEPVIQALKESIDFIRNMKI